VTTLHGIRVLVIDDAPDVLEVVACLLSSAGAEVITASTAESALARVAEASPTVVLCDLMMPGVHGLELARRIHELVPDVPIAAFTAMPPEVERPKLAAAGILAFLKKTIGFEQLCRAVAQLAHGGPPSDRTSGPMTRPSAF
jgi:CheY-like chemotaxis protein